MNNEFYMSYREVIATQYIVKLIYMYEYYMDKHVIYNRIYFE